MGSGSSMRNLHLDSAQRSTLREIYAHPVSHSLEWPRVVALLHAVGEVETRRGDRFAVTSGGRTEVFRRPHHQGDVSAEEVVKLRRFLETISVDADGTELGGECRDRLVVVDHHAATIYAFEEPPGDELGKVVPYDPRGRLRHLHHVEGHFQGQRAPEEPRYYEEIVDEIKGADRIVLFGHGDGHSDAVRHLEEVMAARLEPPLPQLLAEARVDVGSLTEAQLTAAARQLLEAQERSSEEHA